MSRIISHVHRTKNPKDGSVRPTDMAVRNEKGKIKVYQLESETDELDFVKHEYPIEHRATTAEDDLSLFRDHQITWKEVKDGNPEGLFQNLLRKIGKKLFLATKVPSAFDGLTKGDIVITMLGGSGDDMACAMSNRLEILNGPDTFAGVYRIPPKKIHDLAEGQKKDKDEYVHILFDAWDKTPEDFYRMRPTERDLAAVRTLTRDFLQAQKDRIRIGQQMFQTEIGRIFRSPEGLFPEGDIRTQAIERVANSASFKAFEAEETKAKKDLEKCLNSLEFYEYVFGDPSLSGICGPSISGRITGAVQDVRRIETEGKFKAFCGVHVLNKLERDKQFPRKRKKNLAEGIEGGTPGNPQARQAFFLMGAQILKTPKSPWNKMLQEVKARMRAKHPEILCKTCGCVMNDECKKKKHKSLYTDGHILKMALWRVRTRIAEFIYKKWKRYYAELEATGKLEKAA